MIRIFKTSKSPFATANIAPDLIKKQIMKCNDENYERDNVRRKTDDLFFQILSEGGIATSR